MKKKKTMTEVTAASQSKKAAGEINLGSPTKMSSKGRKKWRLKKGIRGSWCAKNQEFADEIKFSQDDLARFMVSESMWDAYKTKYKL